MTNKIKITIGLAAALVIGCQRTPSKKLSNPDSTDSGIAPSMQMSIVPDDDEAKQPSNQEESAPVDEGGEDSGGGSSDDGGDGGGGD